MAGPRWKFDDPVTAESYTFEISANDGGSPSYNKNVIEMNTAAPGAGCLVFEGQDKIRSFEFSGVVLTQEAYEAMIVWFNKRYTILLTDDLSRVWPIYITSLEAKRVRAATRPWKHTYACKGIVVDYA